MMMKRNTSITVFYFVISLRHYVVVRERAQRRSQPVAKLLMPTRPRCFFSSIVRFQNRVIIGTSELSA